MGVWLVWGGLGWALIVFRFASWVVRGVWMRCLGVGSWGFVGVWFWALPLYFVGLCSVAFFFPLCVVGLLWYCWWSCFSCLLHWRILPGLFGWVFSVLASVMSPVFSCVVFRVALGVRLGLRFVFVGYSELCCLCLTCVCFFV